MIKSGVYSIDNSEISFLSFLVERGTYSHYFLDEMIGGGIRILPCRSVKKISSSKQQASFFLTDALGWSLILDGELQLSAVDEVYYHQALVLPAIEAATYSGGCKSILILGGGDGCALREIMKNCEITNCDLVDYDKDVVNAFRTGPFSKIFNTNIALNDSRVQHHYTDYSHYLKSHCSCQFDIALIDLTDHWWKTTEHILQLFHLLTSDDIRVRYVGAQLGPTNSDRINDLIYQVELPGVRLLAFWEIPLISFAERWSFGLFKIHGEGIVPIHWKSDFRHGNLKYVLNPS